MTVELPAAFRGERFAFASRAVGLSAYLAANDPPMPLIHSINASAPAAEIRPLDEHCLRPALSFRYIYRDTVSSNEATVTTRHA